MNLSPMRRRLLPVLAILLYLAACPVYPAAAEEQGLRINELIWQEELTDDGLISGQANWTISTDQPVSLVSLFIGHPSAEAPRLESVRMRDAGAAAWLQLDLLSLSGEDKTAASYYELIQGIDQVQLIIHSQIQSGTPVEIEVTYAVEGAVEAYRDAQILSLVPVPGGNRYPIERLVCILKLPRASESLSFYNEPKPFRRELQRPQVLEYNESNVHTLHTHIPAGTSLQLTAALPPDYIAGLELEEDRSILSELDRGAALRALRASNSDQLNELLQSRMLYLLLAWISAVFVVLGAVWLGRRISVARLYPRGDRCGAFGRYRRSLPDELSTTAVSVMRRRRTFGAGVYAGMLSLVGSGRLRYSLDLFSAPDAERPDGEAAGTGDDSAAVENSLDAIESMCRRVLLETSTFSTQQLRRMSRSRSYARLMQTEMIRISGVNRAEILRNGYLASASPVPVLALVLSVLSTIGAVLLLILTRQALSLLLLIPLVFAVIILVNDKHLSRKGQAARRELHAFRRYLNHFSELDALDWPGPDDWHDLAVMAVALECEDGYLEQLDRISTLQERIAAGFYRRLGSHDLLTLHPQQRRQARAGSAGEETEDDAGRQLRKSLGQRLRMGRNEMSAVLLTSLRYSG